MRRTAFVDFGGVLADDHQMQAELRLARLFECEREAVPPVLSERSAHGAAIREDRISEPDFWSIVARELTGTPTLPVPSAELTEIWFATYRLNRPVSNLLKQIQSMGIDVVVATNCDRYRATHMARALQAEFDSVCIRSSWTCRSLKPRPEFFLAMTEGVKSPHLSVYVDDRHEHVRAFERTIGGMGVVFRSVEELSVTLMAYAWNEEG